MYQEYMFIFYSYLFHFITNKAINQSWRVPLKNALASQVPSLNIIIIVIIITTFLFLTVNILKSQNYLNCTEEMNMKAIFAVINATQVIVEIRPEKNSLHRCRAGHGFTSHTDLNFFQALFSLLLFSNEDHLHLHFLFLLYCAVKCSLEYDADYSAFPHAEGCHLARSQHKVESLSSLDLK